MSRLDRIYRRHKARAAAARLKEGIHFHKDPVFVEYAKQLGLPHCPDCTAPITFAVQVMEASIGICFKCGNEVPLDYVEDFNG